MAKAEFAKNWQNKLPLTPIFSPFSLPLFFAFVIYGAIVTMPERLVAILNMRDFASESDCILDLPV